MRSEVRHEHPYGTSVEISAWRLRKNCEHNQDRHGRRERQPCDSNSRADCQALKSGRPVGRGRSFADRRPREALCMGSRPCGLILTLARDISTPNVVGPATAQKFDTRKPGPRKEPVC